jgi:hypothetical protein
MTHFAKDSRHNCQALPLFRPWSPTAAPIGSLPRQLHLSVRNPG